MQLSNNQQAFLALVRAGLWEQKVRLSQFGKIDYNEVYRLAEEQAVVGLIAAGLENVVDVKVPKELSLQLIGRTLQLENRNKSMNAFIAFLIDKLCKNDIYTLLVKGQGIAQCYERPLWRASGDIDLYLSHSNYEKAKSYLLPIASKVEDEEKFCKHLGMTIDSWIVELHGSFNSRWLPARVNNLIDEVHHNTFYLGEVRTWENNNTIVYLPAPQNDIILVFVHILEHFFVGGVGLRQICDWCRLLWTYGSTTDKVILENRIIKGGILTEWKVFASFAVNYLGMPGERMPLYDSKIRWEKKARKLFPIIIGTGNLGHNKDVSYTMKYSYVISKLISFWNHTKECASLFPVFPHDSIVVWLKLFRGRLAVFVKGK